MRGRLLGIALSAEVTAILLSQYASPQAKGLWLVVAFIVYWRIARGSRALHAAQSVVALLGVVITATTAGWPALLYTVEIGALTASWQRKEAGRGHPGHQRDRDPA